jgi:hypothetical protein
MKVSYCHDIDGLEVSVFDDCFSKKGRESLWLSLSRIPMWHAERGDSIPNAWHLAVDFTLSDIEPLDPFRTMRKLVVDYFPKEKMLPYRAYCNLTRYGDQANAHRDCPHDGRDLTCLFYANNEWEPNWGGETLFYNRQGDTVAAVNPKPGRIVIFRGAILHRNGVPCKAAPYSRYSVAYKLGSKGVRS